MRCEDCEGTGRDYIEEGDNQRLTMCLACHGTGLGRGTRLEVDMSAGETATRLRRAEAFGHSQGWRKGFYLGTLFGMSLGAITAVLTVWIGG